MINIKLEVDKQELSDLIGLLNLFPNVNRMQILQQINEQIELKEI